MEITGESDDRRWFGGRGQFIENIKGNKCTMNNCESEEIVEAANIAISNLLPTKSRSLYDIAYNRFKKWCAEKNVQVYSENVLLAYFSENAKNYKSSTLWAQYSMVKSCLIIYDNIDISKFAKLIAFLKRTGDGYQAKKSKILTKSEIDHFLSSANDKEFLMIKLHVMDFFKFCLLTYFGLLNTNLKIKIVGNL
ncbi:hypothetical protein NQ317_008417 [Molorchus minor]|uniref:Uncharacterized protein n=1 Tax=Molorchus minor TaxID=1323400 RepID=A0ABQ9J1Q7_9CUCU|nr:hypothetical protein NQ317_008417 [Molorchus minor]